MRSVDLNGKWFLYPAEKNKIREFTSFFDKNDQLEMEIPGDIHSALIKNGIIPDPYWGKNELKVQWVGKQDWVIEKEFEVEEVENAHIAFTFLDTITEVFINDEKILDTNNMFRKWETDVRSLKLGKNTIRIIFHSAENAAIEENKKLPYPIPYSEYPVFSPYRNLIRKTQCHSGWDWGPCIMAFGIYEKIEFNLDQKARIQDKDIKIEHIEEKKWRVSADLDCAFYSDSPVPFTLELSGSAVTRAFRKGDKVSLSIEIEDPRLWFPAGKGKQPLYNLAIRIAGCEVYKTRIGFRDLETVNEKDENGGVSLYFKVNGKKLFAKGANWIPIDALPSRQTKDRYRRLLTDMVDANMNMVRVWGGGQYEHEFFYELCDELGILIWHDMMFGCAMYPATESFLENVTEEIKYQIPRLKTHPSIALWCGNNEDIGAINWYEESKNNKERYLADYIKLNDETVGPLIKKLDPSRRWWPSSPSAGEGDFSDNWHSDNKGDMHYWSVWHDGMPFSAYYLIKPRFVSEFGFQSFPNLDAIRQYATEAEFDCYSPVMLHHQKNPAGNEIIATTMERYYGKPKDFKKFVYLSQIQQADAMRIAIEYYRSLMPYTMGTLYWQLDDNWPVASWSSIDYSGKWKALHYKAKHFYKPLHLVSMVNEGRAKLALINETEEDVKTTIVVKKIKFSGEVVESYEIEAEARSMEVFNIDLKYIPSATEYIYSYCTVKDEEVSSFLLPEFPKEAKLEAPEPVLTIEEVNEKKFKIRATIKKPCFDLMLFSTLDGRFNENVISLNKSESFEFEFTTKESKTLDEVISSMTYLDLYDARD